MSTVLSSKAKSLQHFILAPSIMPPKSDALITAKPKLRSSTRTLNQIPLSNYYRDFNLCVMYLSKSLDIICFYVTTTCRRVITSNDIHEPCLSSCRPQIINNIQFPSRCLGDSK